MSAPVDVLAVLDERIAVARAGRIDPAELIAVRDAATELIEAAIDAHDFAVNASLRDGSKLDRRFYRLRAAIAKATGVAA